MTASVDATTDRIAKLIDAFVYAAGNSGPTVAALAVLADAEIREGLAAAPIVRVLDAAHRERRWSDDSTAATCTCGAGWPCSVRQVLDGQGAS